MFRFDRLDGGSHFSFVYAVFAFKSRFNGLHVQSTLSRHFRFIAYDVHTRRKDFVVFVPRKF